MNKLRIGLPKGSLQEATFNLFKRAGWNFRSSARSYQPVVDDVDLEPVLLRAQEIPRYVHSGVLDAGITGYDNVVECEADVHEVAELVYSKATSRPYRWVLAVPNDSPIKSAADLQGKRIATELVGVTKQYLAKHGVTAHVEFSWGATRGESARPRRRHRRRPPKPAARSPPTTSKYSTPSWNPPPA